MRKLSFQAVTDLIANERIYQDNKHGSIESSPHELGTWILLIEAELAEAKQALIKGGAGRDSCASELIQVAALCSATIEQHGCSAKEGRGI